LQKNKITRVKNLCSILVINIALCQPSHQQVVASTSPLLRTSTSRSTSSLPTSTTLRPDLCFQRPSPLTLVSMPPTTPGTGSVVGGLLAAADFFDAGVHHSQVIEGFYVFTEDATPSRKSFPDAIGTGYHWVSFATNELALHAITLVPAIITHKQWTERVNHEHIARNPL